MKINKIKIILSLILLGFCSQNIFAMEKLEKTLGKRQREKEQEEQNKKLGQADQSFFKEIPDDIIREIFFKLLSDKSLNIIDRLKNINKFFLVYSRFKEIFPNNLSIIRFIVNKKLIDENEKKKLLF